MLFARAEAVAESETNMGVGTFFTRVLRRGRRVFSGEFTVTGTAVSAVKFGGEVTVTRNGVGDYTFAVVDGKQGRLSSYDITLVTPSGATVGGWSYTLVSDTVQTNGQFRVLFAQQSWAAAEPAGLIKLEFTTEGVAAS